MFIHTSFSVTQLFAEPLTFHCFFLKDIEFIPGLGADILGILYYEICNLLSEVTVVEQNVMFSKRRWSSVQLNLVKNWMLAFSIDVSSQDIVS